LCNDNNAIINNSYGRLQDLILLFKIRTGTRKKNSSRIFGHAPSKRFASSVLWKPLNGKGLIIHLEFTDEVRQVRESWRGLLASNRINTSLLVLGTCYGLTGSLPQVDHKSRAEGHITFIFSISCCFS